MRDPERLASSNGISDFERELLDAGRNDGMPAAMREQMERALGFSGAAMPATPMRARVEAATGVKASAMVWISAGVVVLGVVGGIVGARLESRLFPPHAVAPATALPAVSPSPPSTSSSTSPSPSSSSSSASAEPRPAPGLAAPARPRVRVAEARSETASKARDRRTRAPRSPAKAAPSAAPAASVTAETAAPAAADTAADRSALEPQAPAVAARERRPASREGAPRALVAPPGDLRAEIDLIDGARAALRAGETAHALDLLGNHAVHFPRGLLVPEETALRVEALMRLGRTAEARAYARRFVADNPASPLAERMRRLVNGDLNQ